MSAAACAVACAIAFAVLTWLVQSRGIAVTLDGLVQAALAPLRQRPLLLAFGWLTEMGTGAAGAAVVASCTALMWSTGRARLASAMWIAFIGAEATTWSIKFIAGRVRPPFIEGVTAASPSYPSAHATVSLAVYGFLALTVAEAAPPAWRFTVYAAGAGLVLLIAFSRLLLSLHYLTDVLGGFLVAAFWLFLVR